MRTKILFGFLIAAFLCVAAGASVAYYHSAADPSQTVSSSHLKMLLRPPSLSTVHFGEAIRSANPANLRYYLSDGRLVFHAALGLAGLLCCAMSFSRAAKLAQALSEGAIEPARRLHAMDLRRFRAGAARADSASSYGLKSRLTRWFGAIAVLLSVASFVLIYSRLPHLLQRHSLERGRAAAMSVVEAVTPQLMNGDRTQLRPMLLNHLSRNDLAYILVFDADQAPLAYAGPEVSEPAEAVRAGLTVDAQGERSTRLNNRTAYDLLARVDNGRLGIVQVGIWRARIEDQARKVLLVVAVLFVAVTYGAILGARRLFATVTRPLEDLTASAVALSSGDLETPIATPASGAMAQLGEALERVRTALKPAISRLKAELDVPARFTVLGAFAGDLAEPDDKKTGDPE